MGKKQEYVGCLLHCLRHSRGTWDEASALNFGDPVTALCKRNSCENYRARQKVHSGFPADGAENPNELFGQPNSSRNTGTAHLSSLTPSAQVWLNTPLSLLPRVEPPPPSLLSPATSPTLPSQHPLGHNGCCPLGTGLPRGIVGAGGWHWLCRETAGIVVPIINETALAAAPQPNPRD